jgi:putative addiction module component (TIGR02574 family)
MSRSIAEITEEALRLPPPEQFKLVRTLLENAQFNDVQKIDQAWEDEIERRIQAIHAGTAKGRPFAEALKEVDRMLAQRHLAKS